MAEIEASTEAVLAASAASLDGVAGAKDPLTYASVVRPLQMAPNYKTNPLVCQSKFLQHCSTDPLLRAAAEDAGAKFAAFKASSRRRQDVFEVVERFSKLPEAAALGEHEAHFLKSVLRDFKRGGLALDSAGREELQRLLDQDASVCARFKTNLAEDKTSLTFSRAQVEVLRKRDKHGKEGWG